MLVHNRASRNREHGIVLRGASGNRLVENITNLEGIDLTEASSPFGPGSSWSDGNRVEDNEAFGNDDGIEISRGSENLLAGNRASFNGAHGFHLIRGDDNRVEVNLSLDSELDGFFIEAGSTNTRLFRNAPMRAATTGSTSTEPARARRATGRIATPSSGSRRLRA